MPEFGGNPKVVVATPDIYSFKVRKNHDFIILGCDGIFDKLTNEDVLNCGWFTVHNDKANSVHKQCGKVVDLTL